MLPIAGKKSSSTIVRKAGTFAASLVKKKHIQAVWSIKVAQVPEVLTNEDFTVDLTEPSITPEDVTDVDALFVADPFLIKGTDKYYLFFEILPKKTNKGVIGLASSENAVHWKYEQIIMEKDYHLSYPYVFEHKNNYYMIPESEAGGGIFLYKASRFPYEWKEEAKLIDGRYTDASLFYIQNKWWMFAAGVDNQTLYLFYADQINGPWTAHPQNPLIENDASNSRPGGRVMIKDNQIFRYVQDDKLYYGHSLKVFQVEELSEQSYREKEIGVVLAGSGQDGDWRKDGVHHIDHLQISDDNWLIAVDGHQFFSQSYVLWRFKKMLR